MPKKIVYLLGSGATHAVIKDFDLTQSLLTADIQKYIGAKFSPRAIGPKVWNELLETRDVEHLISVLEFQHRRSTSELLKSHYRKAILSLSSDILKKLPPNLYTVLCDLHLSLDQSILDEELLCILTLNYEDILERSIRKHLRRPIDYGIESLPDKAAKQPVSIYKLHGSFSWTSTYPIEIRTPTRVNNGKALWIPPGVDKRRENYPFNLLWGKATEALMSCDILRLVGCSLSRNDWGLIPIIYTVQKFRDVENTKIEVIDFPTTGALIKNNYSYLRVRKFSELDEVLAYYRGQFPGIHSDDALLGEVESAFADLDKTNPFKSWLEAKIESIIGSAAASVIRNAKYAYNFYTHSDEKE